MEILLYEPEIPPNTGNIARLCAATCTTLHLVEPLGFKLEDRYLKRAGLDYWSLLEKHVWPDFASYLRGAGQGRRLVMTSARGGTPLQHFDFTPQDTLIFGPETRGLPQSILERSPLRVRIPIQNAARSLNLSTAAGIVLYAALAHCQLLEDWS